MQEINANEVETEEKEPGTVLTKKGIRLIAKMLASETVLKITRAAVGTGSVPEGISLKDMEDLNCFKTDGTISRVEKMEDENQVNIAFQVSSVGMEESFVITEAGIFAEDPDEGEILYGYLDMADDPQLVYNCRNAVSKMVEITMAVIVATTDRIYVEINPGSLVSTWDFEKFKGEIDKRIDELIKGFYEKLQEKILEIKRLFDKLKPFCFKDADGPLVLMTEATYKPQSERTKGCAYGLITRKRGLISVAFDRYVTGREDPAAEKTGYGIETTERTDLEIDTRPYVGVFSNVVYIEEGQEIERKLGMIYAVMKDAR